VGRVLRWTWRIDDLFGAAPIAPESDSDVMQYSACKEMAVEPPLRGDSG